MEGEFEEGVARFTRSIYRQFEESIRGRDKTNIPFRFWDVVVLTAADADQRLAYELQLNVKLERREIPSGVDYVVLADPPGPKIGCGGATMHVISHLTEKYEERLHSLYILLINAGGFSQRLPSASVLGKIFTALPNGSSPPWTILELKMAASVPFLSRMNPGYLHVASDTIEVYDVGDSLLADWDFKRPGLTALAHPSSVDIGTTHGVFVLESDESRQTRSDVLIAMEFRQCVEVLQKPSVEVLRSKGAILTQNNNTECVYTDSLFYIDHTTADTLLEFYLQERPLKCEIDSYGDFMQSMGKNADPNFVSDTKNVLKANEYLIPTRKKLFEFLRNLRLSVVVANASKFYHLGTLDEYLDNLCGGVELSYFCGFEKVTFCRFAEESCTNNGCLINCIFNSAVTIGTRTVVEYCRFDGPVNVNDNSVISNCWADASRSELKIPANVFLHTIPVSFKSSTRYVTLVYHIKDNVKARAADDVQNTLKYFGKPIHHAFHMNVSNDELFSRDSSGDIIHSLWYARLFPALNSMQESFMAAVELATTQAVQFDDNVKLMSAAEVTATKNINEMLKYRTELYSLISE